MTDFFLENQRMRPCLWHRTLDIINCTYADADDLDMDIYHIPHTSNNMKGGGGDIGTFAGRRLLQQSSTVYWVWLMAYDINMAHKMFRSQKHILR